MLNVCAAFTQKVWFRWMFESIVFLIALYLVFFVFSGCLIVRLTIWHHLFLEFWLVNTWFFCSVTSPECCNPPRKCTPVKYKKRQKAGFPIVTWTTSCVGRLLKPGPRPEPWTRTRENLGREKRGKQLDAEKR